MLFQTPSSDSFEMSLYVANNEGVEVTEVHDQQMLETAAFEDQSDEIFKHTPLDHSKQLIQLLHLCPAPIERNITYDTARLSNSLHSSRGDIRCGIRHSELPSGARSTRYSCLSYVWLLDNPSRRIWLTEPVFRHVVLPCHGRDFGGC